VGDAESMGADAAGKVHGVFDACPAHIARCLGAGRGDGEIAKSLIVTIAFSDLLQEQLGGRLGQNLDGVLVPGSAQQARTVQSAQIGSNLVSVIVPLGCK